MASLTDFANGSTKVKSKPVGTSESSLSEGDSGSALTSIAERGGAMEVPGSDLAGRGAVDSIIDSLTDSRISTSDMLIYLAKPWRHIPSSNLLRDGCAGFACDVMKAISYDEIGYVENDCGVSDHDENGY
ncbi:hypothetical protein AB205_0051640, partial [Aquarana catesbeiana]